MAQEPVKANTIHELTSQPSPTDAISSLTFSPHSTHLAVASWDKCIYVYERVESAQRFTLWRKIEAPEAVMDVCWGADETILFYVCLDGAVRMVNFEGEGLETVLSAHGWSSNKCAFSREHGILLSTSWNHTLHIHDPETKLHTKVLLAHKPFALSLTSERVVIAMAERAVVVFDLGTLKSLVESSGGPANDNGDPIETQALQERDSSLKFMTRDVACMIDGTGFATSSIEGRVAVDWFDPEAQKKSYAFKCHREATKTMDEEGNEKEIDVIHPVNALAFHPIHGTFATGGGDGVVAMWDAQTKRRVKQYPKVDQSIAALDFSPDGKYLAIGSSPGFEEDNEGAEIDPSDVKVFIRELGENEAKRKEGKAKKKLEAKEES